MSGAAACPGSHRSGGSVGDPTIGRAVELLAQVSGVAAQPRDETVVVQRLGAADRSLAEAVDDGRVDPVEAFRLAREAHVLHRLLIRRRERGDRAVSARELLAEAAVELCDEYGFDRSMTFEVGDGTLEPVATRFVERSAWADRVHSCAIVQPPRLDLAVHESAVVDGRRTIVVRDAQRDPGSWKPVVVPLRTSSYAVAPVVVEGATVGTIHADNWFRGHDVDERDRDLVGLVGREASRRLQAAVAGRARRPELTKRQVQVIELVAVGRTNGAIAAALDISAETVKSHLKQIFLALGVANRAEAVGRWFDVDLPAPATD